ncbi:hypothetical protein TURU_168042 [Turdus rufiventris]|nr:hypothetical protein TURU_168042 [Turdus rufiventris]
MCPCSTRHGCPQSPLGAGVGVPGADEKRPDRGTRGQGDPIVLQKAVSNKEEPLVPLMDGVGSRTNGCKQAINKSQLEKGRKRTDRADPQRRRLRRIPASQEQKV